MATSPTTAQRRVTLPTAALSQRGESMIFVKKVVIHAKFIIMTQLFIRARQILIL
jgi:hypothetical protein